LRRKYVLPAKGNERVLKSVFEMAKKGGWIGVDEVDKG
jgi:hypothetical protein